MDLGYYRESIEKQLAGARIYIGDACFIVKRWGTTESNKVLRNIRKDLFGPFHKASPDDDHVVNAEWLMWAVTGWDESVRDKSGPVAYNEQNKRNIFTNPEFYLSLNSEIILRAMNFEFYLHEEAEEDEEEIKKS